MQKNLLKFMMLLLILFLNLLFTCTFENGETEKQTKKSKKDLNENQNDFEFSNDIVELKKWNKSIGDNVVLIESCTEKKDNLLMRNFDIKVDASGYYYISSLISGVTGEKYDVYLDMEKNKYQNSSKNNIKQAYIELHEGGWQSSAVCLINDGKKDISPSKFYLTAGKHTITFAGSNIPNVNEIKIASSQDKSVFLLEEYKNEIARLKNNSQDNNYISVVQKKATVSKDNPKYDYNTADIRLMYTYRRSIYIEKNKWYTFETKQSPGSGNVDTVMYLFRYTSNGDPGISSHVDDNGGTGIYSRISMMTSKSGYYQVMVRANSFFGVADIYLNGLLWDSEIPVAGVQFIPNSEEGVWYNYFTTNPSGGVYGTDPYCWVMSGSSAGTAKVVYYNDDFYDSESDFNWGYQSRIHTNKAIRYFIVSCYSPNTDQQGLVYYKALGSESYDIDHIQSSPEDGTYNCISWSGGITSYWVWPPNPASPWYSESDIWAFDNFYKNSPLERYTGAPNYTRTGANKSNSVIDLWASGSSYTHASISRMAPDGNFHGYDWESKLGNNCRIFHPRYGVSDYGSVSNYYKWDGSNADLLSLQESIDKGLTVIQEITLNNNQEEKLSRLIKEIPEDLNNKYEEAYEAWKRTWTKYAHLSNPRSYAESDEYKRLLKMLQQYGKKSWAFVIKKHQEDGVLVISLLEDLMLKNNEHIMDNVRSSCWKKATENKSVYQVPTLDGNWTAFTKEILDSQL